MPVQTATPTSDFRSNANDQLVACAKFLKASPLRRKVWEAIYHHKAHYRTLRWIMGWTGLSEKAVRREAGKLVSHRFADKVPNKVEGQIAYRSISDFQANKAKILSWVTHPERIKKVPTKVEPKVTVKVVAKSSAIVWARPRVQHVSVDEIDSFSKVRKMKPAGWMPQNVSERRFKDGLKKILGELSEAKDHGGEKSDVHTTRLRVGGSRRPSAFALKGPGLRSPLYISNSGLRGNQVLRLFDEPGEVFIFQHWLEIKPDILRLMENEAQLKSMRRGGQKVFWGVIDGNDSYRLYRAYAKQFGAKP